MSMDRENFSLEVTVHHGRLAVDGFRFRPVDQRVFVPMPGCQRQIDIRWSRAPR